jgi:hypothetical protein
MRVSVRAAGVAFTTVVAAVAFAQDSGRKGEDAPRKTTLSFEAPPAEWKAHPKEAKPFLADFDLPAAEGDPEGARANVLFYPMGFEEYRKKLSQSWKHSDGSPIGDDETKVEALEANDLKLRVFELSGTHAPQHGPERANVKLVAVHIRGAGGKWTAWLLGPPKSVDKHRDAYVAWLKTAREVPAAPVEESVAVREVRFVHGAPEHGVPGPWALVAYRLGKHALAKLGAARGSFDLVVTHRAPREVRYACMLDGLLAATGCSPGKMNLVHEVVSGESELETVVLDKASHRRLTYKLTKALRDKIRDVPPAGFPVMAQLLDAMKDDEVFTVDETQEK